jgi:hypothetical protein
MQGPKSGERGEYPACDEKQHEVLWAMTPCVELQTDRPDCAKCCCDQSQGLQPKPADGARAWEFNGVFGGHRAVCLRDGAISEGVRDGRLTVYEFSGHTRANARVWSAATRG